MDDDLKKAIPFTLVFVSGGEEHRCRVVEEDEVLPFVCVERKMETGWPKLAMKVDMRMDEEGKSLYLGGRKMGFWRGNVPALMLYMPYTAIQFTVLHYSKTLAAGSSKKVFKIRYVLVQNLPFYLLIGTTPIPHEACLATRPSRGNMVVAARGRTRPPRGRTTRPCGCMRPLQSSLALHETVARPCGCARHPWSGSASREAVSEASCNYCEALRLCEDSARQLGLTQGHSEAL
ncbi:hypothetical protein ZIOFF_048307 [Zingiber officinale]|uniref:Uncharacterized protein n=1 Tax=Zingiber officinale TaxID=94328 RepID=A0A8J5KU85_ZINOF|nr:hypothetical protein ZIOFF_048307 [Zingiber officinale]